MVSATGSPLNPGETEIWYIEYYGLAPGWYTFEVYLDPYDQIDELHDFANNHDSHGITVGW